MKPTIVVYTHTDMKDVWPMFFGQFKKYISDYTVYVCVNKLDSDIPSDYTQITYDESTPYTERWKQLLKQIKEDVIILDANHFLAGETLIFDIELVEIA
jgi:FKBP-type peptidyl-prolyl cis-trans isomerase 2